VATVAGAWLVRIVRHATQNTTVEGVAPKMNAKGLARYGESRLTTRYSLYVSLPSATKNLFMFWEQWEGCSSLFLAFTSNKF
jgi:hypothetical protein